MSIKSFAYILVLFSTAGCTTKTNLDNSEVKIKYACDGIKFNITYPTEPTTDEESGTLKEAAYLLHKAPNTCVRRD